MARQAGLRAAVAAVVAAVAAAGTWAAIGVAHDEGVVGEHQGMELVANFSDEGRYRTGTDMAFWGDTLVLGALDQGVGPNASGPGGFRLMDISDPEAPRQSGRHICSGDQSDVSIWGDLVLVSVDKPTFSRCTTGQPDWEGLRVVSIADRESPEILAAVETACGSHTNTIVPDLAQQRLLVYVLSYPLAGRYNPAGAMAKGCTAAGHRKFSVVEVPLYAPAEARVLHTISVEPTIGCHDVTVFLERRLAAAACLTETQLWDISEPATPEIVAHIPNPPGFNISHSTAFSNDGRTLVVGDELGGAAASPGCLTGDQRDVAGGLFFFDVTDAGQPELVGTFKLPQRRASLFCTAHMFNVVPFAAENDTDVLVTSWYTGATSVIDFTDVREGEPPRQLAFHIPRTPTTPSQQPTEAATWASYWYRGRVWSNNFDEDVNSLLPRSRGLDVFRVDVPEVEGALVLDRLNPQVQEPLG